MITYFYKFDYDISPRLLSAFSHSPELIHAAIYATDEKYDIPDLKTLVISKFTEAAATATAYRHNMLPAISLIYSGTTDIDRGLRDVTIEFWAVASAAVMKQQGRSAVNLFMFENPKFASDLAMNYVSMRSSPPVDCSCAQGQGVGFGPVDLVLKEKMCLYCRRPLSWKTRLGISVAWYSGEY